MSNHWIYACKAKDIPPHSGIATLMLGRQVAIFRLQADYYATSDYDPFSGGYVLSRGRVALEQGVARVVSPAYQRSFNLETGECLDDPSVRLPVYPVRVLDGALYLAFQTSDAFEEIARELEYKSCVLALLKA